MIIIRVLGSLDTVVRGLVGVYLLVARDVVRLILAAILTRVIPGFATAPVIARVESIIDTVMGSLTGWIDSMASGAASFLSTTPAALNTLFDAVEDAVWTHTTWIKFLSNDVIPYLQRRMESLIVATRDYLLHVISFEITKVHNWVWSVLDAVNRRLSLEIQSVRVWTQGWVTFLLQSLQTMHAYALAYTNHAVTALRIDVAEIRQNLIALINSTARALTSYTDRTAQAARDMAIRVSVDSARTFTMQQLQAFKDLLSGSFTRVVTPQWQVVRDAEAAILKDFPNGAAVHTRKVDAIPKDAPKGAVEASGAVSAASLVSLSWILDAGVPLWRRLHTFGDTVDQMQDDSLIEDILTLLAFAVLDPAGSAKEASVDLSATLTGVVSGTIGSIFPDSRGE